MNVAVAEKMLDGDELTSHTVTIHSSGGFCCVQESWPSLL